MSRKIPVPLLAFSVLTFGAAALAGAQQAATVPPPGAGLTLINERCGFCHSTAQVFTAHKTAASWGVVVQSMIDRGAELSPDEQKVVTEYLAANYATTGTAPGATPAPVPTPPVKP